MVWNKPGNDNNNDQPDPWGGGKKPQGPPNIDKIIADFFNKLRLSLHFNKPPTGWKPSTREYGASAAIIAAVVGLVWIVSGLFIVNPAEKAVVLRFGQFSDTVGPGLHWMARFIDTKYLVDVQKINSFALQGDYLTKSSEQNDPSNSVSTADTSKNLVAVEMTLQYRINDPRTYLFNVVDPDNTIQEVAAGALSDVVGKMKLDEVLTTGREMLGSGVLERTREVLTSYHAGLEITAVTLRKVQAPDEVQAAFNDVNRADQDKATYIQQAQAYASKVVPLAEGNAARILADATAYQQQSILRAEAQVAKFQAILAVYKNFPDLTRERLYLEMMQNVFKNTNKVLLDVNNSNNIVYLPLDKIIQAASSKPHTEDHS